MIRLATGDNDAEMGTIVILREEKGMEAMRMEIIEFYPFSLLSVAEFRISRNTVRVSASHCHLVTCVCLRPSFQNGGDYDAAWKLLGSVPR